MLFLHRKLRLTTSTRWNYGLSLNNISALLKGLERALLDQNESMCLATFLFSGKVRVFEAPKLHDRVVEERHG
jgi:hypothetical protein